MLKITNMKKKGNFSLNKAYTRLLKIDIYNILHKVKVIEIKKYSYFTRTSKIVLNMSCIKNFTVPNTHD